MGRDALEMPFLREKFEIIASQSGSDGQQAVMVRVRVRVSVRAVSYMVVSSQGRCSSLLSPDYYLVVQQALAVQWG